MFFEKDNLLYYGKETDPKHEKDSLSGQVLLLAVSLGTGSHTDLTARPHSKKIAPCSPTREQSRVHFKINKQIRKKYVKK